MRPLRASFLYVSLLATALSAGAFGTLAQAWCCARDLGCSVEAVAASAVDACASSGDCGMPCAESESTPDSGAVPCEPSPERCPLLVRAPAEPARSRPADSAPDDIIADAPFAQVASVVLEDAHASECVLHPRAPDLPIYLELRHLLI